MRWWVKLIHLVSVYTDRYTLVYAIILTPFFKKYICLVKKAERKWQQSECATARYFIKCKQLDYYVSFVDVVWLSRGSSNFGIIWVYDGEGFLSFVGPSTVFPSIYAMHPHDNLCFYDTLLNVFFLQWWANSHTYDIYLSCQFVVASFRLRSMKLSPLPLHECKCIAKTFIYSKRPNWIHTYALMWFQTWQVRVQQDMSLSQILSIFFFLHLFFEVLYTIDLWLFSLSTLLLHFLKVVFYG